MKLLLNSMHVHIHMHIQYFHSFVDLGSLPESGYFSTRTHAIYLTYKSNNFTFIQVSLDKVLTMKTKNILKRLLLLSQFINTDTRNINNIESKPIMFYG